MSESPERTKNKRFLQQKNFSQKRLKPGSAHQQQQRVSKSTNYYWHKYSRAELLASLDSLLQIAHEAEATERSLRQRWVECRHLKRTAQRQLESLQSYLKSPYTMHVITKPIERADRMFTHLVMRDSSLLWFSDRFQGHPAYTAFVTHQDTPTFKHLPFDPKIPFCLEEACFGQCTCLDSVDLNGKDSDDPTSFNHFNLICRDL